MLKPTIELIFDRNCPNLETMRFNLMEAIADLGLDPHWQEWDKSDIDSPAHIQQYPSPTLLVNGQNVLSLNPKTQSSGPAQAIPSTQMITDALRQYQQQ